MLGRTDGVFASVVNGVSTGEYVFRFLKYLRALTGSASVTVAIFLGLGLVESFLVWFFISNCFGVAQKRFFLEGRIYEHVPFSRILYLWRTRKWFNVARVMLLRYLRLLLWSLTIVGYVVYRYAYYMVPYILAENPGIRGSDALRLSKNMMKGHKWECFRAELSFILWDMLGALTFSLADVFFVTPYKACFFAEYYVKLREAYLAADPEAGNYLQDTYLYAYAQDEALAAAYGEILKLQGEDLSDPVSEGKGLKSFLAKNFCITLFSEEEDARYGEIQAKNLKIQLYQETLAKQVYPGRLNPVQEKERRRRIDSVNYLKCYSPRNLVLFFFIFNLVGWLWEVGIHLVEDGVFVNRGVLHGPWLPIYGVGGVLIIVVLAGFRKNPFMEFCMTILLCGAVEYATSFYLEKTKGGTKWWDYSGYFLNLHGRISAEGLLVFAAGGFFVVYVVAPMLDELLLRLNRKVAILICGLLLVCFTADAVYSSKHPNTGEGITDYAARQEAVFSCGDAFAAPLHIMLHNGEKIC